MTKYIIIYNSFNFRGVKKKNHLIFYLKKTKIDSVKVVVLFPYSSYSDLYKKYTFYVLKIANIKKNYTYNKNKFKFIFSYSIFVIK